MTKGPKHRPEILAPVVAGAKAPNFGWIFFVGGLFCGVVVATKMHLLISRRETRLEEMFVCPRPFSPSRAGCAAHVWPNYWLRGERTTCSQVRSTEKRCAPTFGWTSYANYSEIDISISTTYSTFTLLQHHLQPQLPNVDLNIGSGARFAAGLQELRAIEIIHGTSTRASSSLL